MNTTQEYKLFSRLLGLSHNQFYICSISKRSNIISTTWYIYILDYLSWFINEVSTIADILHFTWRDNSWNQHVTDKEIIQLSHAQKETFLSTSIYHLFSVPFPSCFKFGTFTDFKETLAVYQLCRSMHPGQDTAPSGMKKSQWSIF